MSDTYQVVTYLPEHVFNRALDAADAAGESLSAFVAHAVDLATRVRPDGSCAQCGLRDGHKMSCSYGPPKGARVTARRAK